MEKDMIKMVTKFKIKDGNCYIKKYKNQHKIFEGEYTD